MAEWTYKDIEQRGSAELKEILFIVTGGYAPGKTIEEEKENERTQKH